MEKLTQLEQQIEQLLQQQDYPDDFPQQLENLVALRHQEVENILGQPDLTRVVFDDVVARTKALKSLIQKHKDIIGERLVRSKKSKQSLSLYSNIQQNGL
ncbi:MULTISPECIES: flagellar biosynthesis protein FliS [Photobacterium]|uniref:flagellar biosynthesis protein FliS n=1 Tax=Photobacterium TaxID=657 RepID=UPI000D17585A|nr:MULTISPECIES: flagellar biosynthesis protein FliS [Photobacterium]MBP2699161.1 flagellar biosynthesis protein FliS [Vibrio parahaemolyticus]MZG57788.1 flagellar biosynthesis protein FliS [Photobacterium lucens]MZG79027.1 flagellar biosynthesis protein FliS [Photobacterium lucens]PSV28753.1 flagellar biosynthesis protein FliS [Photobacterium sp. GB-56]PSV33397.1 flagellar biosynthesis protein FliS [Photobacterium sp. GB-72]